MSSDKKRSPAKVIALSGMMTALACVIMALGGIIPVATFCCPALAGICLLPVLFEDGMRQALYVYAASALISLFLCPDKEAALLFLFLGWYPAVKPHIDNLHSSILKIIIKLASLIAASAATLLAAVFLLGLTSIMNEYAGMSAVMLTVFILTACATMLIYDRLLYVLMILWYRKLRLRFKKML